MLVEKGKLFEELASKRAQEKKKAMKRVLQDLDFITWEAGARRQDLAMVCQA